METEGYILQSLLLILAAIGVARSIPPTFWVVDHTRQCLERLDMRRKMRSSSRDKELKKKLKKKILGKKKDGVQDEVTTRRVASRRRQAGPKLSSRLYKRIGRLLRTAQTEDASLLTGIRSENTKSSRKRAKPCTPQTGSDRGGLQAIAAR